MYHIIDEIDERGGRLNRREGSELEKAFKEGYEHGFRKAMREVEGYHERGGRMNYRDSFEEKIKEIKERYS